MNLLNLFLSRKPRAERIAEGNARAAAAAPYWRFPRWGITVQARTRSEARGKAKAMLGLDRLPMGTECVRGKGNADGD